MASLTSKGTSKSSAGQLVRRDARSAFRGYPIDLGRDEFFPPYQKWNAQTGLTPAALFRGGGQASGVLKDQVGGGNDVAAVNSPVYDKWAKGFKAVGFNDETDGFQANVLSPANADCLIEIAFSQSQSQTNSPSGVFAYWSGTSSRGIFAYINSGDAGVYVGMNDAAHTIAAYKIGTYTYGHIALLGLHICRTLNTLYTRLSDYDAQTGAAGTNKDITGWTTLSGGTSPLWGPGPIANVAFGNQYLSVLGIAQFTAGVSGQVLAQLHADIGAE